MQNNREKISYCVGLETAKNLKNQFKDIDANLLIKGLADGFEDKTPQLPQEEVQSVMKMLQEQIQMQQKEFVTRLAQENRIAGEKFLEENKNKEGVITLPSGLQYKVLGAGMGPSPTLLDTVMCHYRLSSIDGQVFDSSYERGKPDTFPINRIIPGWSEALQLMKVGDKWQLFIPSYLAYGEGGFRPHIQPNMALIFEIELIAIQ